MIPAYIIHLADNAEREPFVQEIERRVPYAQRFDAIRDPIGKVGCSLSHQACIHLARARNAPAVWIMEDDCAFTEHFDLAGWERTIELAMCEFDILVGGSANGQSPKRTSLSNLVEVAEWSSCHCWVVGAEAFADVLALDPRGDIDVTTSKMCSEGKKHRAAIRVPYVALQAPAHSDLLKKRVNYRQWFDAAEERLLPFIS